MPGSPKKRQRREALARHAKGETPWPSDIPFLREKGIVIDDDGYIPGEDEQEEAEPAWMRFIPDDVRGLLEQEVDEPEGRTFSHKTVQRMAQNGSSDKDIALLLRIDKKKLQAEAKDALELGRSIRRYLLTHQQNAFALAGDRTLLVFLGKNVLGQQDKVATEISGPDGAPIQHEVLDAAARVREKLQRVISPTQYAPTQLPPKEPDYESPASDTHAPTDAVT